MKISNFKTFLQQYTGKEAEDLHDAYSPYVVLQYYNDDRRDTNCCKDCSFTVNPCVNLN